jgi:MFS family permease
MVQSLMLAYWAISGRITVTQIAALSVLQGLVNAFDVPARQAFVVQMIDNRSDLSNAIALNSSMFNGARLIGPVLAGFVIAVGGEGVCFLIDGISYLAVIWTLTEMRDLGPKAAAPNTGLIRGMMEGISYAVSFVPIRSLLMLVAFVSLVGLPYAVLMPMAAKMLFQGGPHTLGFLMSASGVGSLAGAVFLASRKTVRGLVRLIAIASLAFGLSLFGFALVRSFWLALILLVISGFSMIVQLAASNTVLQTLVEDDKRGRVMSLYTMAFMGMMPWGSLLIGFVADHAGISMAFGMAGILCMLGALFFMRQLPKLREIIRPIYAKMGIIPEVAAGLQAASGLKVSPEK